MTIYNPPKVSGSGGGLPPGLGCNSGGPRSRTRTERVYSTVLGQSDGYLRSPTVRRVGLEFGGADPVETIWRLLEEERCSDPEELRELFDLPDKPLLCRADPRPPRIWPTKNDRRTVLEHALWLGLSTPWLFHPARPVLWTRASLTRCLEVFEGEGFYA